MTPILYTCARSRGLRASWAAEELGIALDLRMLPFPPRARARDYLERNPLGTVPMLVDGDLTMTESSAIAHYLATRDGPTPLAVAPGEADYGAFLDYLHHADATLTFPQTVYMRFSLFEKDLGLGEAGLAYADWFAARLIKIEQRIAGRDYLCADRFTVADIAIAYALFLASTTGLRDRLSAPLQDYLARMTARPAFRTVYEREKKASLALG